MKRSRNLICLLLAALLVVALFAGCGSTSSGTNSGTSTAQTGTGSASSSTDTKTPDKVYELSLTTADTAEDPKEQMLEKFAADVLEATGGAVKITVFPGGTLASGKESLDAIKNGVADIAFLYTTNFPGQFPMTDVVNLPMMGINTSAVGTSVLWDLTHAGIEALDAEFANYKLLACITCADSRINTMNKPVTCLDDLKGLKIRVTSGTSSDMIAAWGATPVTISSSEVFSAMQKNTIDGGAFDMTLVKAQSLYDLINYYTTVPFFVGPWLLLANGDAWNEIPQEYRDIIEEKVLGRDLSMYFASVIDGLIAEADSVAAEHGATFITLTDEARAEFMPAVEEYRANWVKNHTTATFDAQEYLDYTLSLVEKYAG